MLGAKLVDSFMSRPPLTVVASTKMVQPVSLRPPRRNEVLIRNAYVAVDPSKTMGRDLTGSVEAVGEDVRDFRVGQKVAALTRGQNGSLPRYSFADARYVFAIGDQIKPEEAVTIPKDAITAAFAIFKVLGLPEIKSPGHPPLLVHGSETSIGRFAVQLARKKGYDVWSTTATFELERAIVDGNAETDSSDTSLSYPLPQHAFDAISTPVSVTHISQALRSGGRLAVFGDVVSSQPVTQAISFKRLDTGRLFTEPACIDFAARWLKQVGEWIQTGELRPSESIFMTGLEDLDRSHLTEHVSKRVYRIEDA